MSPVSTGVNSILKMYLNTRVPFGTLYILGNIPNARFDKYCRKRYFRNTLNIFVMRFKIMFGLSGWLILLIFEMCLITPIYGMMPFA